MEELIVRWGLVAVLFGAALEGDVTLILAGVASHLGLLDPAAALAAGVCGGFAGDAAFYAVGRWRAAAIRRSRLYRRAGPAIERLADRIGIRQIAAARLIYGTRIASMLFWGVRGLSFWRFAAVDLPACAVWACCLGGLGMAMSGSATALIGEVKRLEIWLLGAALASAALLLVLRSLTWRPRGLKADARSGSSHEHT